MPSTTSFVVSPDELDRLPVAAGTVIDLRRTRIS
jgi:hypothetical protein